MSCTICDITQKVSEKSSELDSSKITVISRKIFERMKLLEDDGGDFSQCVKDKEAEGKDHDKAVEICKAIEANKKVEKHGTEKDMKKEMDVNLNTSVSSPILTDFKNTFRELMLLKLEPIENMLKFEKIDREIWKLKDKLWKLERDFNDSGISAIPEEDLMIAKIQVQKEIF